MQSCLEQCLRGRCNADDDDDADDYGEYNSYGITRLKEERVEVVVAARAKEPVLPIMGGELDPNSGGTQKTSKSICQSQVDTKPRP